MNKKKKESAQKRKELKTVNYPNHSILLPSIHKCQGPISDHFPCRVFLLSPKFEFRIRVERF